jgi:hypothetical protein
LRSVKAGTMVVHVSLACSRIAAHESGQAAFIDTGTLIYQGKT